MDLSEVTLDKKYFGRKLNDAICKRGLSYEDLALSIGLNSARVIYCYISGTKLPSAETLLKIALILEVNLNDLACFR